MIQPKQTVKVCVDLAMTLGLHWGVFLKMAQKTRPSGKPRPVLSTPLGGVIAVYGIAAMMKRDLPTYLFLRAEFVFLDFSESKILFYLDYLAMMGTFIFLAWFAVKLLKKRKERDTPRKRGSQGWTWIFDKEVFEYAARCDYDDSRTG